MNKKLLLLIASFSISVLVFSQTIVQPNYGLKSHPTLEIQSIVISPAATTVFMVIENRVLDGSFCADKNIYIVAENGKHIKLISAEGIPVCPDSYKFNNFGDKLHFSLVFPPLPLETKWIDL
ncbi:MAG: hypothetical protein H6540_02215, partial [Bacteroidales bacterium]|nr:hypothetical protein [Bacteroidales bacterium]